MKQTRIVRRVIALVLLLTLCFSVLPQSAGAATASDPTEAQVYKTLMALKPLYPEGTRWTNDDYYGWKGASREFPYSGGWGCVALAYKFSDAAFGSVPCRCIDEPVHLEDVRVGDILRLKGNTHSVVVLEVHSNHVVIVEGNYNKSIHWGRILTRSEVESSYYMLTRYQNFSDVKTSAYYYNAVTWALNRGITSGTSVARFSPNDPCTRAQVVTFLWNAAGKPTPQVAKCPFTDVKSDSYYYKAVLWAYGKGIVAGTSSSRFSPNQTITRQEAVTFLWRAQGQPKPRSSSSPFRDVKNAGSYSYQAILWGYEKGIVSGVSDGLFAPKDSCTRAQIVTFLYRLYA